MGLARCTEAARRRGRRGCTVPARRWGLANYIVFIIILSALSLGKWTL